MDLTWSVIDASGHLSHTGSHPTNGEGGSASNAHC